jgi:hypothetical protein
MNYDKSYEDITETFRRKGKKILKADCITQIFPEDGAFMQVLPVDEYKSVGAILEPNRDIPVHKTWSLIPVIQIHGHPSSKLADYATIKEYLEEIIVCCKSCFAAYRKTRTDDESVFFAVSCGSQDLWIGHNFMQVFNSMQNQWDVECIGIDSNPDNCLVDLTERGPVIITLNKSTIEDNKPKITPKTTNVNTSSTSNSQSNTSGDCFVATATFGTPYTEEVYRYRNFRDNYLVKNTLGRIFIKVYYSFLGPLLAKAVRSNKTLKLLMSWLLSKLLLFLPGEV